MSLDHRCGHAQSQSGRIGYVRELKDLSLFGFRDRRACVLAHDLDRAARRPGADPHPLDRGVAGGIDAAAKEVRQSFPDLLHVQTEFR